MAHLAGGAVREIADGIDGLAGGPGGDEDALAGQIALRGQGALDGLDEGGHLGQSAASGEARGERAGLGLEHGDPALAQRLDIGLHGRVVPHAAVHGRRHQHRASRGEEEGGQEVVGDAVGGLGQEIGRGRRHHEGIRPLGESHVLDGLLTLRIEEAREDRPARERAEGEGAHEMLGVGRHHHCHLGSAGGQLPQEQHRLVGGDAARDTENDLLARESHGPLQVLDGSSASRTR